ncbi:MAG: response regulator [Pseudomonadota bacterium]|nr:response regulator [Pseudomonadota bacterium]
MPARPRRRVLIADDNRDGAESLAQLVAMWDHDVIAVLHDGREAFQAAERRQPDIALLEIGMPGWNGYEVAKRIRTASWGWSVKLIAITGWGSLDALQHALDSGFDGHLTKPCTPTAWLRSSQTLQRRRHEFPTYSAGDIEG